MPIWLVNLYMWISSIKDAGELNTAKSASKNSATSKQANHKHKQQLPSTEFAAKILLDLHERNKLTISEVKDQNNVLSTLIMVCNNAMCMQCSTFVVKSQKPVAGLTEGERLNKAAQVTVSK